MAAKVDTEVEPEPKLAAVEEPEPKPEIEEPLLEVPVDLPTEFTMELVSSKPAVMVPLPYNRLMFMILYRSF